MKINSITTESLSRDRKVVATSKTIFKLRFKPVVHGTYQIFDQVLDKIKEHMSHDGDTIVEWYVVTIKTSAGKFVQSYAQGCFK